MKTLNIYAALLFSIFAINLSFAQTSMKNETIQVSGNCGMCKNKIEKAAKTAGASSANWSEETKVLNVSFNSSNSSAEKIQRSIAAAGYDTRDFKATDKSYSSLMGCCKYERTSVSASTKMDCCKDEKCDATKVCCKGNTCSDGAKDCCKGKSCCEGDMCKKS